MNLEISGVFLIIIMLEVALSNYRHKKWYNRHETFTTIYLSLFNGLLDLSVRGLYLLLLTFLSRFSLIGIENQWLYWGLLFVLIDFQFYWLHRLEHFCRIFWAAHVTHHSAEYMNLSVGFRASVLRPLYDFAFFVPLVLVGFKPIDIFFMYSLSQFWAVLLHTKMIGRLPWLEYFLVTPSLHRVHHASNARYLDKNMGMTLIVWDRLFGTFQRELPAESYEPIRYGLTSPVGKQQVFNIIFNEWISICNDVKRKDLNWKQKLGYIFGPPGWSHDGKRLTSKQLLQKQTAGSEKFKNS